MDVADTNAKSVADIKDLNLAIQKADENEQHIKSLVANAPFPICLYVGKEMRVALANKAALDMWGKGSEVIGKLLPEIE